MKLREVEQTTVLKATTKYGVTDVLVTNSPDLHPGLTLGRVVMMPQRSIASLVTIGKGPFPEKPVIDHLTNLLLEQVLESCASVNCGAITADYDQTEEDIGVRVVASGVICERAIAGCDRLVQLA